MRAILIALLMVSLAGAEDWAPDQHIDDVFPISFNLHDAFGAASDADSAPAYRWYEDGTNMSALNSTLSLNDSSNTDGYYRGTTTLSAANGFEVGKNYELRVSAVVDGVTGAQVTKFRIVDSLTTTIQAANDSRFDDIDTQLDSIEGTLDLTNAQVEAITDVSQLTASGATIGVGTQASGTYASTATVDGTTHDILADSEGVTPLSVTYSFTVPTGGIGTKVTATTESTSVQLRTVSAYNYLTSTWDTIGTASHTTMTEREYPLGQEYTSGAGAMQIRFTAGSTYADQTLGVDGLIVNYRQNLNDAIAALDAKIGDPADTLADDIAGISSGTPSNRLNYDAALSYQFDAVSMADGTYKAVGRRSKEARFRPGAIAGDGIVVQIDMAKLFGSTKVKSVGTPTISGGSLTAEALGVRETSAMLRIDGTATASEERTCSVDVTMDTDEVVPVTFDIKVFGE